jgi:uncharacterized protein
MPGDVSRRVRGTADLIRIYQEARTIAVVGASVHPDKPAHAIPAYLQDQGYRILPVNPRGGRILGEPAYRSLSEIDGRVDVVDVFRPPTEAETVAREAIVLGAPVLWFQPGTHTEQAVRLATDAGLLVVTGRCMGATHAQLGLEPLAPGQSSEASPGNSRYP